MPTYTEPEKSNILYHEPSATGWFSGGWFRDKWFDKSKGKGEPSYTEIEKANLDYGEPQWISEAVWKDIVGLTWKDIASLGWKELGEMFGYKVAKPTYSEASKGTVSYTEPPKE